MNSKQKYVLTEEDLRYIIDKSLRNVIYENLKNEEISYIARDANGKRHFNMFGMYTRRQNKKALSNYHASFLGIYSRFTKIQNDIKERVAALQSLVNVPNPTAKKPLGEGALKTALSAYKKFSQKAAKIAQKLSITLVPASFIGPEKISNIFKKKNGAITSNDLVLCYEEVINRLSSLCEKIEECPEILGSTVFYNNFSSSIEGATRSTINGTGGQEDINSNNAGLENERYFDTGTNLIEMATTIGVTYIPYVGWILGALDDVHMLLHQAAQNEQGQLQAVGSMYTLLQKVLPVFEDVLNKSKQAGIQSGNNIITQANNSLNNSMCKYCNGTGIITNGVHTEMGYKVTRTRCPYCNGTGTAPSTAIKN